MKKLQDILEKIVLMRAGNRLRYLAKKLYSAIFPFHKSWLVLIALLLLTLAYWMKSIPLVDGIRGQVFDLYQVIYPRERISAPVTIVDIDEDSLRELGQWPWPRDRLAEIVDKIGSYSPVAIGLDLLLAEPDRSSPCEVLKRIQAIPADTITAVCNEPSNDQKLAQAMSNYPVVVGIAGVEGGDSSIAKLSPLTFSDGQPSDKVRHFASALTNISELHSAASGWGLVSADMERGIVREIPMVASIGDQYIPSLTIEMLRIAVGAKVIDIVSKEDNIEGIRLGDLWIDTTESGSLWLHYSPHETARFVSALSVLNGKVDAELLQNRLVLLGVTGLGLVDYVATPLGGRIPGVEVHAQILETVFDGSVLVRPDWGHPVETALLLVVSLIVIYLLPRIRIWMQLSIFGGLLAVIGITGLYLFHEHQILLDIASPTLFFGLLYFALLADSLILDQEKIDDLESRVLARTQQMMELQDVAMEAMGALAESRDSETGNHIRRTQNYVKLLAERLQKDERYAAALTPEIITYLYKTAPLHDIGKIGVPDRILLKPEKLTDDEFVIMKKHPEYGLRAIEAAERKMSEPSQFLIYAKEIIYGHHEKWDGSGYPQGLAGEQIPLSARLMAIADVYDALICRRCYKQPFSHEQAVAIILKGRGTHFDPSLVDAFSAISDEFYEIALKFEDKEGNLP